MPNLPVAIISVLSIFLPLFYKPTFKKLCTLFCGHVLCKGSRTITELLKRLNLKDVKNYSKHHDFFKKDKWSIKEGSKILFLKLASLVPGELIIAVDSTVERRKGPKIKGLGLQRDAVKSTKSNKVLVTGINWLVFSIIIKFPWCSDRPWAVPFYSISMPPEEPLSSCTNEKEIQKREKKKHKEESKKHTEKAQEHIEEAKKHIEEAKKHNEEAKKNTGEFIKHLKEFIKHSREAEKHAKEAERHVKEAERHTEEDRKYPIFRGHRTMTKLTCQVVLLIRSWLPEKKIRIVGDSAFATYALANRCIKCDIKLVSRMRLDARTFEFPSEKKGRGRKRLVGNRLPTFKKMLEDPSSAWKIIDIDWYGGARKKLESLSGTCLWYGYGITPVPIKWVLTRELNDNSTAMVVFTTDIEMTEETILENFVSRWALEVTFEEVRRHLGMETQRQWSDKAIERVTPCILASYSVINLIALESISTNEKSIPIQQTSWYKKDHATFSDVLAYLRREILEEQFSSFSSQNPDIKNIIAEFIDHLAAA